MDENERYVKERWNLHFAKLDDLWMPPKFHIRVAVPSMHSSSSTPGFSVVRDTEAEAWFAAKAFTVEREKQIAEVEDEIAWLTDGMDCDDADDPIGKRILAREQAALDELKKGMKL